MGCFWWIKPATDQPTFRRNGGQWQCRQTRFRIERLGGDRDAEDRRSQRIETRHQHERVGLRGTFGEFLLQRGAGQGAARYLGL